MPEDRRNARRARLSGVRVTYESATGDVHEADVANLSRDGIFIASLQPLAVGKRLTLELLVAGETGAWAALGRVIWIRTASEGERGCFLGPHRCQPGANSRRDLRRSAPKHTLGQRLSCDVASPRQLPLGATSGR